MVHFDEFRVATRSTTLHSFKASLVNPSLDVAASDVVFAVKKLVEGDGLF